MLAWKIAPALACGNTVVLKPAETTSLTALKFAELCQDAGLPEGVVNIVTGAGQTGSQIVSHPDIHKIAFTGSTEVGKIIMKSLAGTDKKYTLELGGKGPNIIFEDAPVDQAVEGIINAIFFNQGHVCCAGSRLLVQEGIADKVIQKLRDRMESLIVGDPLDKNTDIGAINSKQQYEKINDYLEVGVEEGADIFQSSTNIPDNGFYCKPTIFTNVGQSNRIVQEEIFGPVASLTTFKDFDEAIEISNDTLYGLGAGVWTRDAHELYEAPRAIKAGRVWVNNYHTYPAHAAFGGYKKSGFGRENHKMMLDHYRQNKNMLISYDKKAMGFF